ncbi:phosphomethylpyrimidine kinase [Vibrio ponticus]|nr:phosphomethylpyrimidine kinase [Vibrio ponticus]
MAKISHTPSNKASSHTPIVLTIAGSDSGGGAGIQADIKAISATGSYACSVITAITSQNTQGVNAIFPIPLAHVESNSMQYLAISILLQSKSVCWLMPISSKSSPIRLNNINLSF